MIELKEGQGVRLYYALHFTNESLAMCQAELLRGTELTKVANEMLKLFVAGEMYPNSETELLWKDRELQGWTYNRDWNPEI